MSAVDEYIKKYPDLWDLAQYDPAAFLTHLAGEGIIEYRMIDPLLAQHELAKKVTKPTVPTHVLMKGPSAVYDLIRKYLPIWEEAGRNTFDFIDRLVEGDYIVIDGPAGWEDTFKAAGWVYLEAPAAATKQTEGVHTVMYAGVLDYFVASAGEVLKSLWLWIRENVPEYLDMIWGHVKATFEQYWPPVQTKIEQIGLSLYDHLTKFLLREGPVTPEMAPEIAVRTFELALGAGITAHALSVGFELIHPFKELGFHQMTAMVAQLGSFGPVSAATLGTLQYGALRQPMQYYVNKITRSRLPDDQLLQIMAVKPDIPMDLFIETMKYHGFSDFWIDRIRATMFREPRYMELKMMAEDAAANDEWMFRKARRAGYDETDSRIFVDSLIKTVTRTQRQDYYKQASNLFKEGYIQREHLNKILEELELRPEAVTLSVKSAELAYLYDTISDEVAYWTDSYLKDLIDEEELELQLSLLGINRWRVDLKVRRARVRKYKKPAPPEATELEKAANKIRSTYAQAYITLYRKDQFDLADLLDGLLALGILPELVEATCVLEAARKGEELPAWW